MTNSARTARMNDLVTIIETPVYTYVEKSENFIRSVVELDDGGLLMALLSNNAPQQGVMVSLIRLSIDGPLG